MYFQILVEAFVVGIAMVIIDRFLQCFTGIPKNIFVIGFIGHIFFEVIGANQWYCKNGNACK